MFLKDFSSKLRSHPEIYADRILLRDRAWARSSSVTVAPPGEEGSAAFFRASFSNFP